MNIGGVCVRHLQNEVLSLQLCEQYFHGFGSGLGLLLPAVLSSPVVDALALVVSLRCGSTLHCVGC